MPFLRQFCLAALVALAASGCNLNLKQASDTATLKKLSWQEVPGWHAGQQEETWPSLQHNCKVMHQNISWKKLCQEMLKITPSRQQARQFYEDKLTPYKLYAANHQQPGLLTGYYVPLLHGSWSPSEKYRYPIYAEPSILQAAKNSPDGQRILAGSADTPFYSRSQIENHPDLLAGNELLWVDNAIDAFFLHVQGSGYVQMLSGEIVVLGFANHNGHPYTSIGKVLIEQGELSKENVTLFSIKDWLQKNPLQANSVLHQNARYIFFQIRSKGANLAEIVGSMNIPLSPERSVAIDPEVIPLGSALWLQSNLPGEAKNSYQRMVFAQDTGAAIKNALRADLFWGQGKIAEQFAGRMQEPLELILLLPKNQPLPLPTLTP